MATSITHLHSLLKKRQSNDRGSVTPFSHLGIAQRVHTKPGILQPNYLWVHPPLWPLIVYNSVPCRRTDQYTQAYQLIFIDLGLSTLLKRNALIGALANRSKTQSLSHGYRA